MIPLEMMWSSLDVVFILRNVETELPRRLFSLTLTLTALFAWTLLSLPMLAAGIHSCSHAQ